MRTLSSTLLAAQKAAIGEPVVQVVIDDRHAGAFRPRWETVVEDDVPAGPHVIAMAYDGAILRARVDPGAGRLHIQRVTDPAEISQWTSWQPLQSNVCPSSQIALAWDGNTIQALFFVAGDQRTIMVRESSDNGLTWGGSQTVATLGAGRICRSLAATLNAGSGTLYCLYSDEDAAAEGDALIVSRSRAESGGAWSSALAWGRPGALVTRGMSVAGVGERLNVVLCINRSLRLFSVACAELQAWPDPVEVIRSDSTDACYAWPSIAFNFDQHYYVFFSETNVRAGYTRLNHVFTTDWVDASMLPRPYALSAAYGACSLVDSAYHYLCTSSSVLRARRWGQAAGQRLAVGADVLRLHMSEGLERPGRVSLELRNDDGRYSAAGTPGACWPLTPAAQVSIRLGYRTGSGEEVSYYRPYWITRLSWRRRPGASTLAIEATDGWGLLDAGRARQSYVWGAGAVGALLRALLLSAGFAVTDDGDDAWQTPVARFAINPGASFGDAVRRLLRLAGGYLIFRSDPEWEDMWPSAVAHLARPATAGVYAYGAEHPIIAADICRAEQAVSHVLVLGEGETRAEAIDWATIELCNADRVALVIDRRLGAGEADARAASELAAWQQATESGSLVVPPNVGQEVLDIIAITDRTANLSDAERLVAGNDILLDRGRGVFEQRLDLARP